MLSPRFDLAASSSSEERICSAPPDIQPVPWQTRTVRRLLDITLSLARGREKLSGLFRSNLTMDLIVNLYTRRKRATANTGNALQGMLQIGRRFPFLQAKRFLYLLENMGRTADVAGSPRQRVTRLLPNGASLNWA